jgi:hypothetical protein
MLLTSGLATLLTSSLATLLTSGLATVTLLTSGLAMLSTSLATLLTSGLATLSTSLATLSTSGGGVADGDLAALLTGGRNGRRWSRSGHARPRSAATRDRAISRQELVQSHGMPLCDLRSRDLTSCDLANSRSRDTRACHPAKRRDTRSQCHRRAIGRLLQATAAAAAAAAGGSARWAADEPAEAAAAGDSAAAAPRIPCRSARIRRPRAPPGTASRWLPGSAHVHPAACRRRRVRLP